MQTGTVLPVSVNRDGAFSPTESGLYPRVSRDGHYAVFAWQEDSPTNAPSAVRLFYRDLLAGVTEPVDPDVVYTSQPGSGDWVSFLPAISPDGNGVAYAKERANLLAGYVGGDQSPHQ